MAAPEPTPDHSPYADPEPLRDMVAEVRSAEADLEAHGVNLHPAHHLDHAPHTDPLVVSEEASHVVDGMSDYGS